MPFEEIPVAQGPFGSGQDNQEPIYDASRVKIGADVLDTTTGITMEDIETGGGGSGKRRRGISAAERLQRHLNARLRFGGEYAELASVIINAIRSGFENLGITFPINVDLDGGTIWRSQKKYVGREVGLFT
jgi:hypothetical protein